MSIDVQRKLISVFIKEQSPFFDHQLKDIIGCDDELYARFKERLIASRILKRVQVKRGTDEILEEGEEIASSEEKFAFYYVGIVTYKNIVLKLFPKYMNTDNLVDKMKVVLQVIEKYKRSQKKRLDIFSGGDGDSEINRLSIILSLLNDYDENGVYISSETVEEVGGHGEILWDKTVNEIIPHINNNTPIYFDYFTSAEVVNENDYIMQLHKTVLTNVCDELKHTELDSILGVTPLNLSERKIEEFGDLAYVEDMILKEANCQFNTRKRYVLELMMAYIRQEESIYYGEEILSVYGSKNFHIIWEKVCQEVFINYLREPISSMLKNVHADYNGDQTLISVIEKPRWYGEGFCKEADTLEPDLISYYSRGKEDWFVIMDAKYYLLEFERDKKLRGNPGISDLTKQYLYQLAYNDFVKKNSIAYIRNFFLMPRDIDDVVTVGQVGLNILDECGLGEIQVRYLPANTMFEFYLLGTKLEAEYLKLDEKVAES